MESALKDKGRIRPLKFIFLDLNEQSESDSALYLLNLGSRVIFAFPRRVLKEQVLSYGLLGTVSNVLSIQQFFQLRSRFGHPQIRCLSRVTETF